MKRLKADVPIEEGNDMPPERRDRRRWLWLLILLLLFLTTCSVLEGSMVAIVTRSFRLDDGVRAVIGDEPLSGLAGDPVTLPGGASRRGFVDVAVPGGRGDGERALSYVPDQPSNNDSPAQAPSAPTLDSEGTVPVTPEDPNAPADGSLPPQAARSAASSAASSATSFAGATSSHTGGATGGGAGGGATGGGAGGGGTGGGGVGDTVVTVTLRSRKGEILHPLFHFKKGTARLQIDERSFVPGLYTLRVVRTNTLTGESTAAEQEFPWGVLALNTDNDRYRPGETGAIHMGVLDEFGEMICDAALTLQITAPSGAVTTLSTGGGGITVHDSCTVKEAGLIEPDYSAAFTFSEIGTHSYLLSAIRPGDTLHAESSIDGEIQVVTAPPFIVKRTAATRLWPFAPSTMTIEVEFLESFAGTIADIVPQGFLILSGSPTGVVQEGGSGPDTVIRWTGSWTAGETATFQYVYDAPDISPQFYLLGPLQLTGGGGTQEELRSWQIANDAASSSNYRIKPDVISSGGGDYARSSSYLLADTIGEPGAGPSGTANYSLDAGYRQTLVSSVSLGCESLADMGSIVGFGLAEDSIDCTVITDADAGYSLSWVVPTGSGGTNTGHLINPLEQIIQAYTPAVAGTPETWNVSANDARWGGRLRSASTDADAKWGTDSSSEKWLNVGTGSYVIVQRPTRTAPTGSTERLSFRTEVGASKIVPDGTYTTTIFLTASSL